MNNTETPVILSKNYGIAQKVYDEQIEPTLCRQNPKPIEFYHMMGFYLAACRALGYNGYLKYLTSYLMVRLKENNPTDTLIANLSKVKPL